MKRWLVYYDKDPVGRIDAVDYMAAKRRMRLLTPRGNGKHMRIRLAREGLLLALANQKEYAH